MKAILLIDKMPSDCYHCQLYDYEYQWCYGKDDSSVLREEDIESKRIEGCPLKTLPTKKKPSNPDESWEEMHERWGYNKCIEEIEE